MHKIIETGLEFARKAHNRFWDTDKKPLPLDYTGRAAADKIRDLLLSGMPCMITMNPG